MLRAAAQLGLGPSDFWQLSVREWRWLAGGEDLDVRGLRALLEGDVSKRTAHPCGGRDPDVGNRKLTTGSPLSRG